MMDINVKCLGEINKMRQHHWLVLHWQPASLSDFNWFLWQLKHPEITFSSMEEWFSLLVLTVRVIRILISKVENVQHREGGKSLKEKHMNESQLLEKQRDVLQQLPGMITPSAIHLQHRIPFGADTLPAFHILITWVSKVKQNVCLYIKAKLL